MIKVGLLVRLEAKNLLHSGLTLVQNEPETMTWYAIGLGSSTFGIFDTFPNDAGRSAHLSGQLAAALMAKAGDLLVQPPLIEKIDILAAKLPN